MKQAVFDWTASLRHGAAADAGAAHETTDHTPPPPPALGEAEVMNADASPIDRARTIERLLELNPTVHVEFLEQFSDEGLEHYLSRLIRARRPRGRDARWVRRNESRAIVAHTRVR